MIMAAVVQAVHNYADLMRMSIASPGNDFRLGAMEAPPAIISTYLGEALTNFLEQVKDKGTAPGLYDPAKTTVNMGVPSIAPFQVPAEDRNRTSPFPYGGHRFEFRAVGSSQNVSMVNTVLCTIFAESFAFFSEQIEGGKKPADVAATASGAAPPSIASEKWRNESAMMEQRTVFTIETFCDEPTARNSKRWPPYGKGEVRLRSSAGTVKGATESTPRLTCERRGASWDARWGAI